MLYSSPPEVTRACRRTSRRVYLGTSVDAIIVDGESQNNNPSLRYAALRLGNAEKVICRLPIRQLASSLV